MNYELALDVLANPTRRAILAGLRGGPRSAGDIGARLPVTQPAVSQHLKVLRKAGIVSEHRDGAKRIYRVEPESLADLRSWLDGFWSDALTSYKEAIEADAR